MTSAAGNGGGAGARAGDLALARSRVPFHSATPHVVGIDITYHPV